MVARPAISASLSAKPRTLSVQTSKSRYGKTSSKLIRTIRARAHQENRIYDMALSDLNVILRSLRVNQIFGEQKSSLYDPAIDIIRAKMDELKNEQSRDYMEQYISCCSEIERYKEIEARNTEKERLYSKFDSWEPTVKHEEYHSNDKVLEAQVRLHEISQRCEDFKKRERIFKIKAFGKRLAPRVDF